MSWIECERCGRNINSDDEPNCIVELLDGTTETICDDCQERAYMRNQERLMEDGPGPSLLDQQRDAYKIKHGIRS